MAELLQEIPAGTPVFDGTLREKLNEWARMVNANIVQTQMIEQRIGLEREGAYTRFFRLQAVHHNYVTGKMIVRGAVPQSAAIINIAKDPELQRKTLHGLTVEGLTYDYTDVQARTVTDTSDSSTEDQIIVPNLVEAGDSFAGSIIRAVTAPFTVGDDDDTGTIDCRWTMVGPHAYCKVAE